MTGYRRQVAEARHLFADVTLQRAIVRPLHQQPYLPQTSVAHSSSEAALGRWQPYGLLQAAVWGQALLGLRG